MGSEMCIRDRPKAEVNAILDNSSVPLNARAEQLKLEDFANIANNLGD